MNEEDKKFENSTVDNFDEMKDEVAAGAKIEEDLRRETELSENKGTSEMEARRMLTERTEKAQIGPNSANKKSRRLFIALIAIGIIIWVVALIFALVLGGQEKKHDENSGKPTGNEREEISLGDATVQGLYQVFLPRVLQSFYAAELSDDDSREIEKGRIGIALTNAISTECKGDRGISELCYSGEIVKAKYRELFGGEIEFTIEKYGEFDGRFPLFAYADVDRVSQVIMLAYNADTDEFYQLPGGWGSVPGVLSRLEKAYRDGDELTLMERVLMIHCRPDPQFDAQGILIEVGEGSACEVKPIVDSQDVATFGWTDSDKAMTDEEIFTEAERLGIGGVKMVFQKNVDGKYVFKKMEAILSQKSSSVEELSLEDETVKGLYAAFGSTYHKNNPIAALALLEDFYPVAGFKTVDEISDMQKYAIVLQGMGLYNDAYMTTCKGDYDFMHWVDENGVEHINRDWDCISGSAIRARSEKFFGRGLDLRQFDGVDNMMIIDGEGVYYSADNDEAMVRASGATYHWIDRRPYKVEKDDNRLFIYEAVGRIGCWMSGQTDCTGYKLSGEVIPDSQNLNYENMLERLEDLDKFKWTFRKDGDGHYILERIERVEE